MEEYKIMFTFSFNWLNKFSPSKLDYLETKKILNLQGFDIQKEKKLENDFILTIEVKSNRPDCLCVVGILREIFAYYDKKYEPINPKTFFTKNNNNFQKQIKIENVISCPRFSAIIIKNIDNYRDTPQFIKDFLLSVDCNIINAVVDIINYMILSYGQPLHVYDLDKIEGELKITNALSNNTVIKTLDKKNIYINDSKSVIISDNNDNLVLAGIIGSNKARVDKQTKNILVECANFHKEKIRYTSKKYKISTISSFRYERGVNISNHEFVLGHASDTLIKYLGGKSDNNMFDFYPAKYKKKEIIIEYKYINKILGCNFTKKTIKKILNKYNLFHQEEIKNNTLKILPPNYRLDLVNQEDIIEEIARGYGYHKIKPKYPKIKINCKKFFDNKIYVHVKNILLGMNFDEVLNYSFINIESNEKLNILYSDDPILLDNPISKEYAIMRSNLLYSLLNNIAFNYSKNNKNLRLFEIGKTYHRDLKADTNFREHQNVGLIFSGIKIEKGFGLIHSIKHDFYDMNNYLSIIFFDIEDDYSLIFKQLPFFKKNRSFLIFYKNKKIGFLGEVEENILKKIDNGKLIKDPVYYVQFKIEKLKKKSVKFLPLYKNPSITREYNFVINDLIKFSKISLLIKNVSKIIKRIDIKDVYIDKKQKVLQKSILLSILYEKRNENIKSEEIEVIEKLFLDKLSKNNVRLK